MARNGKQRLSPAPSPESLEARKRKVEKLKQAVDDGTYSIQRDDIVLGVLREVIRF